MNLDAFADTLKRRGCESVWYFHTDHFEPWSTGIDGANAAAVERMAAMARASAFSRHMNLFYAVHVPYWLEPEESFTGRGEKLPHDAIVFGTRNAEQDRLAKDAVRPLLDDGHEFHLHLHHEFWTRNTSEFDNPASRWVNAHSTAVADQDRLDLALFLSREAIAAELGRPFDSWAFIHGNWALNGSDPTICQIDNELTLLMQHGCFGDFSFPAGRGHCDPTLNAPFTCRPIGQIRAYDDPRSDPQPITRGSRVMGPDRFFIWNSALKSTYSSLDYYTNGHRDRLKNTERMLKQWLEGAVVLANTLFLKTHAHSMSAYYGHTEPGFLIPHRYPDTVRLFDALQQICDRARIELRPVILADVMGWLHAFDGTNTNNVPVADADNRFREWRAERSREASRPSIAEDRCGAPELVLKGPYVPDGGAGWSIDLPIQLAPLMDNPQGASRSALILLENGRPLGPAHAVHDDIRNKGSGAYSFWRTGLWFSTTDNSDPNTNGRRYSVELIDHVSLPPPRPTPVVPLKRARPASEPAPIPRDQAPFGGKLRRWGAKLQAVGKRL